MWKYREPLCLCVKQNLQHSAGCLNAEVFVSRKDTKHHKGDKGLLIPLFVPLCETKLTE